MAPALPPATNTISGAFQCVLIQPTALATLLAPWCRITKVRGAGSSGSESR